MNISKFISKFFLTFLVFSSVSIQGPIFALGGQPDTSIVKQNDQHDQYAQENPLVRELRARELRKRSKLKRMFLSTAYLAFSACGFYGCYIFPGHPSRIEVAAFSVICGVVGTFGMYDFLKARLWGR